MAHPEKLSTAKKWLYALGQLGWSLGSYGALNLVNYFYNPPAAAAAGTAGAVAAPMFPLFIGSAAALGIVASTGRLFDAITDPLIAGWSDRSTHAKGRRLSFMRWAALPFVLFSLLIFLPPSAIGVINVIWLWVMSFIFYFAMTAYVTPFFALLSELGHDPEERLQLSTMISITWALGFMIGSQVYALQGFFEAFLNPLGAFRAALAIFGGISLILMYLPVIAIDERRYCLQTSSSEGSFEAVKNALGNPDFRAFVISDLAYWLGLTFVQTGIAYYVVVLLGLPKEQASLMLLTLFLASFLFYVPVGIIAAKTGKKRLLVAAFVLFIVADILMLFWGRLPLPPLTQGLSVMVLAALPIAIFGILPNAIVADVAEDDGRQTGNHKAAVFFGARTLMQKVGIAITLLIFPVLSQVGSPDSRVNAIGVRLTLIVSAIALAAGMLFFLRYRETEILERLRKSPDGEPNPATPTL